MVADKASPVTGCGETPGPSGLNGRGKIIITKASIGSTLVSEGSVMSSGRLADVKDSVMCKWAGPTL